MNIRDLFRRPGWRSVILGLACGLAVWLLSLTHEMQGIDDWMLDWCFNTREGRVSQAKIVIIGLDERSFEDVHKPFPFLSPELAQVVRHANAQGAKAIGIDLFVPQSLSAHPDLSTPGAEGDARELGAAILAAGNVVLPEWGIKDDADPAPGTRYVRWIRPLLQWQTKWLARPEPMDLGFINLTEDDDQFVRRQQLLVPEKQGDQVIRLAPHFALSLFCRAQGQAFQWDDQRGTLSVGDTQIPLDRQQMLRINFVGPPGSFRILPFDFVLQAAKNDQSIPELDGAVVLVGISSRLQNDAHATPYANYYANWLSEEEAGLMPGTEIHAHILATLMDRAFIRTLPRPVMLFLLLVFGVGLAFAFARVKLVWGVIITVVHHFAWKSMALAAFVFLYWRVGMASMLLLGVVVFVAHFILRWSMLRRMLGVVKSEQIAMLLEQDPGQLHRLGEEREVTVLFADIRNFSAFSDKHTPPQVVKLLNAYYGAIVPCIDAEGGMLNSYMGDGIMVIFGAPARQPDHALRAVRAAVAVVAAVHDRITLWKQLGFDGLRIGVGIHTGKVVVGAIGSPIRLDYTAIGDTVNAASRIEGVNKLFQTEILITQETRDALPAAEAERLPIDASARPARVRGIQREFRLHEVRVPPLTDRQTKVDAGAKTAKEQP
jgi:adenylate cyclase